MFSNLWHSLIVSGVKPGQSADIVNRIKIINQFVFFGFLVSFPAFFLYLIINSPYTASVELAAASIFVVTYLITKKNHIVGAFFMLIFLSALLLIISLSFGSVGAEYFFFSLFIFSFYIFRTRWIIISLLIYLITLFCLTKIFHPAVAIVEIASAFVIFSYLVNIVASFLSGAVFLYFFILEHEKHLKDVEKKNTDLALALVDSTQKSEDVKTLLKELNHRVKNNLQLICSLISIEASKTTDINAKKTLLDSKNRIISIALLHKKFYKDEHITNVSFKEYIDDLMVHLIEIFDDKSNPVKVVKSIDDFDMKIDNAVTLGLIINELLTNCFRHGLTGSGENFIKIRIKMSSANQLSIEISDSGHGIEKIAEINESQSFGIGLVRSLVKQMDGTISFAENGENSVKINLSILK
jgi:two-component sensor histidine kinase